MHYMHSFKLMDGPVKAMSNFKQTFSFLIFVLILILLTLYLNNTRPPVEHFENMAWEMHSQEKIDFIQENTERKRILAESCRRDILRSYNFTFEKSREIYYVSTSANTTYCKVPKAGSSLISRLFLLTVGVEEGRAMHVQGIATFGESWPLPDSANTALQFLVARDPYSRLYSAYIDKYFQMEHLHEIEKIQQRYKRKPFTIDGEMCGYNITFQDFLDYSLDVAFDTEKKINRHWSPLYLLCHPCEVDYHVIAKQETLSRDLKYIIKHMNISLDAKAKLSERVSSDTKCDRIKGVYRRFRNLKDCPSPIAALYRIWESFKIQGYISADADFPFLGKLKDSSFSKETLCSALQNTTEKFPLTKMEVMKQRRKYLVDAYAAIREDTIHRIQQLYHLDFILLGYSRNRPI